MLQFVCLQMCVYGGGAVPRGVMGDRHVATVPQGVVGDRLPLVENDKGGGGTRAKMFSGAFSAFDVLLMSYCSWAK